jgi:CheY-like chemotaxis protein/tetratricopeptide (TPR) repeat protein
VEIHAMAGSILYIDDDRTLCQIVAKALREEGYETRTGSSGRQAVASICQDPPDLVLLDILLPDLDGFGVLERIRRLEPPARDVPVVLVSGCTPTPVYAERANTLQAVDLLTKPVPLQKFLEVVVQQIGEAKPAPPAAPAASAARKPASRRETGVSGTLDRIPFPLVLHHLHGMRASGVLHLTCGKKRKWIQLRDGYPLAVRSNVIQETLGHYLVRNGRITKAELEESLSQTGEGKRQGEVLVAMDVLSEDEMVETLREQADEKIFEIFSWESGSFRFERGRALPRANLLGVDRSPANLILEGVRLHFPLGRIDRYFEQHADDRLSHGESPFYRFQEICVEPSEDEVLRGIDGSQRLGDFSCEGEELRRTIYGLIAAGFLELCGGAVAEARVAEARVAEARPPEARVATAAPAVSPEAPDSSGPQTALDPRQEDERHLELVKLAEQLRGKNYFELLGATEDDGTDVLRHAYERLAVCTHPDRFSNASQAVRDLAEELYGLVKTAYDTLTDPRARTQYLLDEKKRHREDAKREKGERALEAETEFLKGEAALKSRDYETAMHHFGRALELYPDEGNHHAHYGWALYLCHPGDAGMVGEALEHVKRGLKLASHREKPYLFLGRLYKAIGRVEMAERMFTRAVQVQPECLEGQRELRLISMRRKKSKGLIGRLLRR